MGIVLKMADEDLRDYLPAYGDRFSVRNFCKEQDKLSSKSKLVENLRKKFKRSKPYNKAGVQNSDTDDDTVQDKKTVNAGKKKRLIEIGWLNFQNNKYVQVRTKQGGGSRKISISKSATRKEILAVGQNLFFPLGLSPKGPISDFDFDVTDFKEVPIGDETVGEIYEKTKLPCLRFYVATKEKVETGTKLLSPEGAEGAVECSTHKVESDDNSDLPDVFWLDETDIDVASVTVGSCTPNFELVMTSDDDGEVRFGPINLSTNSDQLDDTIPVNEDAQKKEKEVIRLRRADLMNDIIQLFADESVWKKNLRDDLRVVGSDGRLEKGEGEGVARDCMTAFWNIFKDSCTVGQYYRVPYLRHDFMEEKWQSVARILFWGWKSFGYFPIFMAKPFIQVCLSDKVWSSSNEMRETFLQFASEMDADILRKALNEYSSVDEDDILEALSSYNCRKLPTADNLKNIIDEISHKELIQEPMFVAKCFQPILFPLREELTKANIDKVYDKLFATNKKVLKIISFPQLMTHEEATVSGYLKKYVKEMDSTTLSLFLRFCTGCDLMVALNLSVSFYHASAFTRRPVAHTCTYVLELPVEYDSYPQFRTEFNSILNSGIWIMDIA